MCLLLARLVFVIFLCRKITCDELKQVNLIYRHGDRSPMEIFPTDPNTIDKWPQGLGWLSEWQGLPADLLCAGGSTQTFVWGLPSTKLLDITIKGMEQHYLLGQWLRERYVDSSNLMSSDYKRVELEVHSSDAERCLMSAYSNLAGLFPPSQNETFHPDINWQPIPVHTQPTNTDNMLNLGAKCPKYDELLAKTFKSERVMEIEKENKGFYEFLEEKTTWKMNTKDIWKLADTFICERSHNMTLAPWVNETVYNRLVDLDSVQMELLYDGKEMRRLMGGPLLKQFITNMQAFTSNSTPDVPKMFMYSGHDTTVTALLSALDLFNGQSPGYAYCVLIELHQDTENQYYINIFYKNETYNDTAVPLVMKGCTVNCSLDTFIVLTKHMIPTDWDLECGNTPNIPGTPAKLSPAWIVAIVLGSILVLVLVLSLVLCLKLRKNSRSNFLYGKFDVST